MECDEYVWAFIRGGREEMMEKILGQNLMRLTLLIVGIAAGVHTGTALGGSWEQCNGPFGGVIRGLAADSSHALYAVGDGGVFRTTNHGHQWNRLSTPTNFFFNSLGNMLVHSSGTFLVSSDNGVLRSTDRGATWEAPAYQGMPVDVRALLEDSSGTLYGADFRNGILTSSDTGRTWQVFSPLTPWLMSLCRTGSGFWFAGGSQLYRSSDRGRNWDTLAVPISQVRCILESSAGVLYASGVSTVLRSRDGGRTWLSVLAVSNEDFRDLCLGKDGVLYLCSRYRVQRSTDEGTTWQIVRSDSRGPLTFMQDGSGVRYIGGFAGVHVSEEGTTWERRVDGIAATNALYMCATRSGAVLASTFDGVFITRDEGRTWSLADSSGLGVDGRIVASRAGVLYAGVASTLDLSRSTDDGATWLRISVPVHAHAYSCGPGEKLYIASEYGDVYQSTDRGAHWISIRKRGHTTDYSVSLATDDAGTIYLGRSGTISASHDGGGSWMEVSVGPSWQTIESFCQTRSGSMLAGTVEGIYASSDGGASWRFVRNGGFWFIESDWNGVLYMDAGTSVYRSNDGLATLEAIIGWGQAPWVVRSLCVSTGGYIYVGTQSLGVFRSKEPIAPAAVPVSMTLGQNFPNPFNGRTVFELYLPEASHVRVEVYDVQGRLVDVLRDEYLEVGRQLIAWNVPAISSGVYYCRVYAGGTVQTRGMVLIR